MAGPIYRKAHRNPDLTQNAPLVDYGRVVQQGAQTALAIDESRIQQGNMIIDREAALERLPHEMAQLEAETLDVQARLALQLQKMPAELEKAKLERDYYLSGKAKDDFLLKQEMERNEHFIRNYNARQQVTEVREETEAAGVMGKLGVAIQTEDYEQIGILSQQLAEGFAGSTSKKIQALLSESAKLQRGIRNDGMAFVQNKRAEMAREGTGDPEAFDEAGAMREYAISIYGDNDYGRAIADQWEESYEADKTLRRTKKVKDFARAKGMSLHEADAQFTLAEDWKMDADSVAYDMALLERETKEAGAEFNLQNADTRKMVIERLKERGLGDEEIDRQLAVYDASNAHMRNRGITEKQREIDKWLQFDENGEQFNPYDELEDSLKLVDWTVRDGDTAEKKWATAGGYGTAGAILNTSTGGGALATLGSAGIGAVGVGGGGLLVGGSIGYARAFQGSETQTYFLSRLKAERIMIQSQMERFGDSLTDAQIKAFDEKLRWIRNREVALDFGKTMPWADVDPEAKAWAKKVRKIYGKRTGLHVDMHGPESAFSMAKELDTEMRSTLGGRLTYLNMLGQIKNTYDQQKVANNELIRQSRLNVEATTRFANTPGTYETQPAPPVE